MKLQIHPLNLMFILNSQRNTFFEIGYGTFPQDDSLEIIRTLTWHTLDDIHFLTRINGQRERVNVRSNGRCDFYQSYKMILAREGLHTHVQGLNLLIEELFPYSRNGKYVLGEHVTIRSRLPGPTPRYPINLPHWTQLF